MSACQNANVGLVQVLLEAGADPRAIDRVTQYYILKFD